MKKFVYVLLVLAILLGVAYLLKGNQAAVVAPENEAVEEVVAVDVEPTSDGVVSEEAVVVVDEEPAASEGNETVAEDVVEENPEETSDEGETVVD